MSNSGYRAESIAHVPVVRTTHKVAEGSEIVCLAKEAVFSAKPKAEKAKAKWQSGQLLPKKKAKASPPSPPAVPLPS